MSDQMLGRDPADAVRHVAQMIHICTPDTVVVCRDKWAAALRAAATALEDAAHAPAAAPQLGPRAREALHRVVENAMRAGLAQRPTAAQVRMQVEYARGIVETAMIADNAEAEMARMRAAG